MLYKNRYSTGVIYNTSKLTATNVEIQEKIKLGPVSY